MIREGQEEIGLTSLKNVLLTSGLLSPIGAGILSYQPSIKVTVNLGSIL